MEALSFRSFIESAQFEITVEECGPLLENEIIGQYADGLKKYRVTFHAPKNMRAWKKGDFEEDVVYVISDSPHTAKRLAADWITQRLDPRESDARPRRVPKSNYLRDTEKRHFDMRSRVVGSWKQIIEMLGFAAERKQNAVDFIDEPELGILVGALHGRTKKRLLAGLTEFERRGLRQLLLATKKNPGQWSGGHGSRAQELASELTVELWPRRENMDDIFGGPTATPLPAGSGQLQNSVYRRKLTQRDVDAILARVNTYADAIKEANRLGIPKANLDSIVASRYEHEDKSWEERRRVFTDLYKRLHIPSSHDVFADDHVDKYWQKRNFDWEAYATEVLPTFGFETIRDNPGWDSNYEQNAEYTDWAVEWLWDLYKAGPPRRKNTQAQRYKEALEEVLTGHMQDKQFNRFANNYQQPAYAGPSAEEEIPF